MRVLVVIATATDPNLTDWVGAAASLGAAFAAVVLLWLAYRQMRAGVAQADAAAAQVDVMRREAARAEERLDAEALERVKELAARDEAIGDQIAVVASIAEATRDAARAQLQPVIIAHSLGIRRGPVSELDLAEGHVAFTYRLANEGTGIALNVVHGVEIAGADLAFGEGLQARVIGPRDTIPPFDPSSGQLLHIRPLMIVLPRDQLPAGWEHGNETYWTKFENVFGDEFETRNPRNPRQPAALMKVEDITPPDDIATT